MIRFTYLLPDDTELESRNEILPPVDSFVRIGKKPYQVKEHWFWVDKHTEGFSETIVELKGFKSNPTGVD